MAAYDEALGDDAEGAEGEGVLDLVAEESAVDEDALGIGAGLGVEAMAVLPVNKRAAELDVAEVVIPGELGDLGLPRDADGGVGEGAEAERHFSAGAGSDGLEAEGWVRGDGARRWRGEGGLFNAGLLPGRHEAREVFRVGEECEDQLDGVGKPLLGVEGVRHL